jgi:hypothetical protein
MISNDNFGFTLLDEDVNVEDFIPIIRQMQFDLDTVLA